MKKIISLCKKFFEKKVSRRQFLKIAVAGAIVSFFQSFWLKKAIAKADTSDGRPKKGIKGDYDIVLTEGDNPYNNTVKAIESMGGMARFVKKDSLVVIKPNMAWDRTPQQAGNTDPNVVAALVDLCYKAGAKRVNIFDIPCNDPRSCYERSGIQEAARAKGAQVFFADDWNVLKAHFAYNSPMEGWPILRDAIKCDTFINVPVLKDHGLTGLTISMKNLMGVCAGNRGLIHVNIGRKLADLTDFMSPDLTVVDAHRVLVRNGPSGGNLADVVAHSKLIVATDPTFADAYAAKLVGRDPMSIPNIKNAVERNIGSIDFEKAKILSVKV